jgi:hypothetical protein
LANTDAGDRSLYDLARRVHGWGRIETVERLAETTDPEIQRWMITNGFRNNVMYEYLAMTCAVTGRLAEALDADDINDDLVTSAGELLAAILNGQPGPSPNEYADLVPALRSYLGHVARRTGTLQDRSAVAAIRRFLDEPYDVDIDETGRTALRTVCDTFLRRAHFRAEAERHLLDHDRVTFAAALEAAEDLELDVFEALFTRIDEQRDEHAQWYALLQDTDEALLDRVLALGRRFIDLTAVATGPSDAIGLGPEFRDHSDLSWFLQALVDYPGRGWDFVTAGLASPSIQNRNGAIRVLQKWPREIWPDGAIDALRAAIDAEVAPKVRTFAEDVLRGDVPIGESWRRAVNDLENDADLAIVTERLSATGMALQLRVSASPFSVVVWSGGYDTDAWKGAFVSVGSIGSDGGGLAVTYTDGADGERQTKDGLTVDEAVIHAERQLRRLVMG